ncbi:MAG: lipopolysaccharide biosynthesis protein [Salinivirgaceae bacterium]|nr:lipopolysaccharide biosynthesis protein [Salinivirgaceae bacterium]
MAESLKDKTIKGVAWSGIDNITQYAVTFVVSIVLARLLSPDDYGLLGLIAVFTAICTTLINGGFTNALIRKKDVTNNDYNTVFIINFGMSLLLYAVLFCCAPFIADFFERKELVSLTRVSSLGMIIGALAIIQQTRLTKQIDFKTQTKITIYASIISGLFGIIMALLGYGVWALVTQSLVGQIVRTILLWKYNHWIPQIYFSKSSFKELFGFGWKLMTSSLLDTIWRELNQVVIGKFYNPAILGQYTRATHFSSLFSSNLTGVIQRVTFPVLSNIQDDNLRLISAYRRIIKTTMFITATSMFFLGAISEPLLYCLIGSKWSEAATYLPLICIAGSLYPLHAINLNMLQVQGRSDLFLGLEVIKKIIGLIPLFVGAFVGVIPMLYINIVIGIMSFFLNSYYSGKCVGYSSLMQLKDISSSYGIAIVTSLSVYFLKYLPISNWIILPIQIVLGAGILFSICIVTNLDEYRDTKALLMPIFAKFKRN